MYKYIYIHYINYIYNNMYIIHILYIYIYIYIERGTEWDKLWFNKISNYFYILRIWMWVFKCFGIFAPLVIRWSKQSKKFIPKQFNGTFTLWCMWLYIVCMRLVKSFRFAVLNLMLCVNFIDKMFQEV